MRALPSFTRRIRRLARDRKGAALMLVLLLVGSIGALAAAGIYLAENAAMMSRAQDRETELRYAADNALAIAKSRMNINAGILPDTGFDTLFLRSPLYNAANQVIPGVDASAYIGPTGDASGQTGVLNGTVLVEARTPNGVGFVRALEVTQESFAKYAYWSNRESPDGSTIYFGGGDVLNGPVWSNDQMSIHNTGATFKGTVGTARGITSPGYATFQKGYKTNQPRIELPTNRTLGRLQGYANVAGFAFAAPNAGDETQVAMRIDFVAADLNADGDSTDADEGLFRVFTLGAAGTPANLRADWPGNTLTAVNQCGDWHNITVAGVVQRQFFPASLHTQVWLSTLLQTNGGFNAVNANNHTVNAVTVAQRLALLQTIMGSAGARCYPAGDPHLAAIERRDGAGALMAGYTNTVFPGVGGSVNASANIGGTDNTFTPIGRYGRWTWASNAPAAQLLARFTPGTTNNMANYMYAAFRGLNPGARGVVYVNGTVAVSGVLRGRLTMYAENGNVVFIDDLRYAKDPSIINPDPSKQCEESDIFGVIAGRNIVIANNGINAPVNPGDRWRYLDDSPDTWVHSVVMALNTSFRAEGHDQQPDDASQCSGNVNGRGCLYLTGGVIQEARGAVGTSGGTGYTKRYAYDNCAADNPPPYFPTTGRFIDNEYTEVDPVGFNAAAYFRKHASRAGP